MEAQAKLETVTPAKAEQWLDRNTINRKLRPGVAEKYADDMKHDRWTECPVPITFYEDGGIADGQHRLWAIVESEKPQQFYIVHDLPREAGLNIDTGLARSIVDNARISGLDGNLSNELVSLAGFYHTGDFPKKGLSNAQRLELVQRSRAVLDWAVAHGPSGKGFRNTVMLSAVARAFAAGVDCERLQAFCRVISSGFTDLGKEDSSAIAMRNYIIGRDRRVLKHEARETFLKAQNAIYYFIRRRQLNTIRTVNTECYPLRREKKK